MTISLYDPTHRNCTECHTMRDVVVVQIGALLIGLCPKHRAALLATLPPDPACRWCAAGYPFRPYDDSKSVHLSHDKTHAIGECEALPPDPEPTTREPCGAWREPLTAGGRPYYSNAVVGMFSLVAFLPRAESRLWSWEVRGPDNSMMARGDRLAEFAAAQLAAEDAADALLLAGRRALGRIR